MNCVHLNELDLQSCENISKFQSISNLLSLKKLNLYRTNVQALELVSIFGSCINLEYLNIGSCTEIVDIKYVLEGIKKAKMLVLNKIVLKIYTFLFFIVI